ncbi:unnamed protein product [Blepharisma stoltei]|uniref:RBR-type E3 ubiquitin transferase n=1 Tax=Blepharisma stoltei TaxID=1481888 RepID=A0AAU9K175_9CILI|nr:unnamed protein product [Blepharisma stoltei]
MSLYSDIPDYEERNWVEDPFYDSGDAIRETVQAIIPLGTITGIEFETTEEKQCPICFEIRSEFIKLSPCSHTFCKSCFNQYLDLQVHEGQVVKIKCCEYTCSNIFPANIIRQLLSGERLELYDKLMKRIQLQSDPNIKWCPYPNCEGYDTIGGGKLKLQCNICHNYFCAKCNQIWHGRKKCKTDKKFERWASQRNAKACPKCFWRVEKNGGCSHMTCIQCGHYWCWNCGNPVAQHSEFKCMFGRSKLDLYWHIIFMIMLFPFWYLFAAAVLYNYIERSQGFPDPTGLPCCLKFLFSHRFILYLLLIILSPIAVILIMIFCGHFLAFKITFEGRYYSCKRKCLFTPFILVFGFLMEVLFLTVLLLSFVLSPAVGMFFFLMKIFCVMLGPCDSNQVQQGPMMEPLII